MGQIRLPVMVGNKEHSTTAWMNFMVIRSPSPYNGIIGRPGISAIRGVPSTAYGMLKFPVDGGIVTIYNTAAPPKECNTVTCDVTQRQHATKVTNLKVAIHPDYPEQEVSIGRPRTAVKGQILADFLIEKPETDAVLPQSEVKLQEPWILFTDGSSCVDGSGAGLILTNPEGMEFTYALRFEFTATNNEVEYEALIADYAIAALEWDVQDNMIQYLDKTKSLIQGFDRFTIRQVPRGDNKKADALSKIASTSFAHLSKQVLVEILKNKSISEMEISTVIEEQDPTWMTPIIEFISKGTLPHEQKDARRIRRTAQRFELRNGVPLSTFVPTTMAPMRRTYSGRLCAPRDSCGFMQYALRTTICSSKSLTVWVLLAHHAPRPRCRHDKEMQWIAST
ncbi:reverse transcriptase domain-containing protein [Tanacetum coccineum]